MRNASDEASEYIVVIQVISTYNNSIFPTEITRFIYAVVVVVVLVAKLFVVDFNRLKQTTTSKARMSEVKKNKTLFKEWRFNANFPTVQIML